MKKRVFIVILIILILIVTVFMGYNNKYTKDEIKFSKEYSVEKDNNANYITYSSLLEKLNSKKSIIFIGNSKNNKSKKLAKKVVFLVKDYNTEFYYYDIENNKKYSKLIKILNIEKLNYPIVIFVKDNKPYITNYNDNLDDMFEKMLSDTCGKDSMC